MIKLIHLLKNIIPIKNPILKNILEIGLKNLGNDYNPMTTENILLEMFNDSDLAKARIKNEILEYKIISSINLLFGLEYQNNK